MTQDEKNTIFLQCLESAGVDNWEGYDDAVEMYEEEMKRLGEDPWQQ